MRVLPDTNLLVRAAISRQGMARQILSYIGDPGRHVFLLSDYLLDEVARVLGTDRIRRRLPWNDAQISGYVQYLARAGQIVTSRPLPAIIADPKDQAIIEAAVSGRADVLCTLDRHFYTPEVLAFCAGHRIRVMTDVDLLLLLRDTLPF